MKNMQEQFPEVILNEDLYKYSTFQIGGPADYFFKLKKSSDLKPLIDFSKSNNIDFYIFSGGSNILFDDKGFRGLVIKIETKDVEINGEYVKADAGMTISKLIKICLENELMGLEKWVGLPGTVGGAVRGNAGCNGLETLEIFEKATLLNPKTGEIREEKLDYFDFSYRHSKLKETKEIVLDATFKFQHKNISDEEQKKIMDDIRRFRLTKQPFGKTTGSFFKNPKPDKPAGMLIDQAGLKGKTIGNAQISEKHGNFFLNKGGATSKEMIQLVDLAKREVEAKFGIELEAEVEIVPEKYS